MECKDPSFQYLLNLLEREKERKKEQKAEEEEESKDEIIINPTYLKYNQHMKKYMSKLLPLCY